MNGTKQSEKIEKKRDKAQQIKSMIAAIRKKTHIINDENLEHQKLIILSKQIIKIVKRTSSAITDRERIDALDQISSLFTACENQSKQNIRKLITDARIKLNGVFNITNNRYAHGVYLAQLKIVKNIEKDYLNKLNLMKGQLLLQKIEHEGKVIGKTEFDVLYQQKENRYATVQQLRADIAPIWRKNYSIADRSAGLDTIEKILRSDETDLIEVLSDLKNNHPAWANRVDSLIAQQTLKKEVHQFDYDQIKLHYAVKKMHYQWNLNSEKIKIQPSYVVLRIFKQILENNHLNLSFQTRTKGMNAIAAFCDSPEQIKSNRVLMESINQVTTEYQTGKRSQRASRVLSAANWLFPAALVIGLIVLAVVLHPLTIGIIGITILAYILFLAAALVAVASSFKIAYETSVIVKNQYEMAWIIDNATSRIANYEQFPGMSVGQQTTLKSDLFAIKYDALKNNLKSMIKKTEPAFSPEQWNRLNDKLNDGNFCVVYEDISKLDRGILSTLSADSHKLIDELCEGINLSKEDVIELFISSNQLKLS